MKIPQHIKTGELARAFGVLPESVRAAVYRKGSYYGIIPVKGPNGRLLWPADAVDRLLGKERGQ